MISSYRYFFQISYSGVLFSGSQKQTSVLTVFGHLEKILKDLFKHDLRCIPCGRTDAGVHAYRSYCHCDFPFDFEPDNVIDTINNKALPLGLYVHQITLSNKHALSDAIDRTYSYFFTYEAHLPHYLYHSVALISGRPNYIPSTSELRSFFQGNKNFYSLCNYGADVKSYIRHVKNININQLNYSSLFSTNHVIYRINITANGFLYKMVRHIVGITLHSMANFTNISTLIDYLVVHRPMNYTLAPVQGLHLQTVNYE